MSSRSDNEKLELVFLKLGLADSDSELQSITLNFLTPVLSILASEDGNVRAKVIELLTHLNKRLQSRGSVQLPVRKLLDQLNDSTTSVFTKNFSFTYLKFGIPRLSIDEKKEIVPLLFFSMKEKTNMQKDLLMRFIIENLSLVKMESSSYLEQLFNFSSQKQEATFFLDFCLDFLLLTYNLTCVDDVTSSICPSGLSVQSVKRLLPDSSADARSSSEIETIKMSILNLIKTDVFSHTSVVCHLVVASADTKHTVSNAADIELRRLMSSLDWDDVSLNQKLYKLYLGQAGIHSKKAVDPDKQIQPADIRLKLKLIGALVRSKTAGECFPQTIQVAYDGLFGKTNSKLQLLTLQFVHSIIDKGDGSNIQQKQAPLLFDAMLKISNNQELSEDVRSMAFIGLGKLSKKFSELFRSKMDFLQNVFELLSKETFEKVKESIQESLVMFAFAYKDISDSNQLILEAILEKSFASNDHRLQFVAVHFAATAFPTNHVPSRYQLLLTVSQADSHAAMSAHKLLFTTSSDENISVDDFSLPSFSAMLTYIYDKAERIRSSGKQYRMGGEGIAFPPKAFQAMLVYLRRCLLGDPEFEFNVDVSKLESKPAAELMRKMLNDVTSSDFLLVRKYLDLCLEYLNVASDPFIMLLTLEVVASSPLDNSIEKLLSSPNDSIKNASADQRTSWMKKQAFHTNEKIRFYAAEIYSIILDRQLIGNDHKQYKNILQEYLQLLSNKSFEIKHGSILVLGYVIGNLLSASNEANVRSDEVIELITDVITSIVALLTKNKDSSLLIAACLALGEMSRRGSLPIPTGSDQADDDQVMESDSQSVSKLALVRILSDMLTKNTSSHQLREAVVCSLGRLPVGDAGFPFTEKIINALLSTAEIKNVELHFGVGSALCSAALGVNSLERWSKWEVDPGGVIPGGCDKMKWMLDRVLSEYVTHRIPAARQASAVWLMVIMKNKRCVDHPDLRTRLVDLHNAFQNLLSESDELTQDIASKGFGIVYELADDDLKKTLVDQLVDSLTGSRKAPKIRILDQEDTPLLPGSSSIQLGKAPDGSNLSTYKELCSLASDLNQPDLVYKFMQLANHHSQWNSKKGAAFGFRGIADAAREQLTPHLPRMVPRLYRYTFDPYPPVRSSMTSIWNVIATSPQKTVSDFYPLILEDLLQNLTSNVWRNREASCLALNNLLQLGGAVGGSDQTSERNKELVKRLPEMWKILMRVADDIKETVRKSALETCKRMKKVTIRLCDDKKSGIAEGDVLSDVLSVLLNNGLGSSVDDVKKLSLSLLVELSKLDSEAVKPCIPQMVGKLLEALSGLESPVLNYMQARGTSGVQGVVDEARVQMIKSSPMMETCARCLEQCDGSILKEVVLIIIDLVKRSAGTPTKAACSYAIRTLLSSCKDEIQPYCPKIINAFVSALHDRSPVIRRLHGQTIGHLCAVATDDTVEKLLIKMKSWYLEKEDSSLQHASASVVQAVAHKSPDILARHSALVLPLAFYGMHERSENLQNQSTAKEIRIEDTDDESVAGIWKAIWNEFTPSVSSAVHLYFPEIFHLCSSNLDSSRWVAKSQAARSLSYMIEKQHSEAVVAPLLDQIIKVLVSSLKGRVWEGKHHLIITLRNVSVHCAKIMDLSQKELVVSVLLNESKRGKNVYRIEAVTSLASVLAAHSVPDKFDQFWSIVLPILKKEDGGSSDSDDEENRANRRNMSWMIKEKVLSTLSKVWLVSSPVSKDSSSDEVFRLLLDYTSSSTHGMQLISMQCLSEMLPSFPPFEETCDNPDVKNICQMLVTPICTCLGDMKYVSTREAALKVVSSLANYIPYLSDENKLSLLDSLKSSPLNTSSYQDYDVVVSVLDRLKPT